MSDEIRCTICHQPISEEDLAADGSTVWKFTPDSEAGPERSEFSHSYCIDLDRAKSALSERLGMHLEIGRGWAPLVTRLVDAIDSLGVPYGVDQVKEKFAGLSFYWHIPLPEDDGPSHDETEARRPKYEELQGLIDAAEEEAARTCEVCGETGTIRQDGWLVTRCDAHHESSRRFGEF